MKQVTNYAAHESIAKMEPFTNSTGNLTGRTSCDGFGRLPRQYRDSVSDATYVVYSYATPIAWVDFWGEVVIPAETYSRTTSCRHQPVARRGMSQLKTKE